jgi:hypothetical protein
VDPGHQVACHFYDSVPIMKIDGANAVNRGKLAIRLAVYEAAKERSIGSEEKAGAP